MRRPDAVFDAVFDSAVGRLGIALDGERLRRLAFLDGRSRLRPVRNVAARRVQRAILDYLIHRTACRCFPFPCRARHSSSACGRPCVPSRPGRW